MKKGGYFTDYSILGRSPLFRGIPAGDFGVLLEHLKAETRSYKKGDLICHAGEHTNALGIVLTGSVTIESDDIFGNRSVLDKVGPGQVFAETYACVPNEPMLVNVAAAENCTVLFLKTAQILSPCAVNCRHHGKLIENLLLVSAQKNLSLSRRISTPHRKRYAGDSFHTCRFRPSAKTATASQSRSIASSLRITSA